MWGNLGAAVTPPMFIWIVTKSATWDLPAALVWIVGQGPNQNWNLAFLTSACAFAVAGVAALGIDATIPIAPEDPSEKD
jgi:hypothetical protein